MSEQAGPPINDVSADLSVKLMVHGHTGSGKTTLIGSGGKDYKTLIIRPPTDHTDSILGSGCKEWIVHTRSDMDEDVTEYLQHEGDQWDWVWLDSISAYQQVSLDDIWQEVLDRRPDRKGGPIDKGEYGRNMTHIQQWVRRIVGMSMAGNFHLGITAWSEELWDEHKQNDILKPWVQGRMMSDTIMGYMNLVGFLDVSEKGRRTLRFDLTDTYYGKDGFTVIPKKRLLEPTIPKLIETLKEGRVKAVTRKKHSTRKSTRSRKSTKRKRTT